MTIYPRWQLILFASGLLPTTSALCAQQDWRRTPGLLPSSGGAMAQDPFSGGIVRFGGTEFQTAANTLVDTTYRWNGQDWTEVQGLQVRPPARLEPLMSYDYLRQRTVLYGGLDSANVELTDTWEWDGMQWSQVVTTLSPGSRRGAAMAFDGANMILFGGILNGAIDNQTWSFDGSDWTLLAPGIAPSPRAFHTMASGPSEILLFGGPGGLASGPVPGDTWRWNGSSWTELATAQAPLRRIRAALSYDPVMARYLLFGGLAPIQVYDTWQLVGGQWSQLATQRHPTGFPHGAAAYHYASNRWVVSHVVGGPNPVGSSVTFEFGTDLGYVSGYGTSCGLRLDLVAGQPRINDSFSLQLATVVGLPLLAIGWSKTVAASGPLPRPLSELLAGAPNCLLLQSNDIMVPLPMQASPTVNLQIPNHPSLVGGVFYVQGFDLPGLSLASLRVSRALECGIDWL